MIGKKVICIDASLPASAAHFERWLTEGEEYTIRRVEGSLYQGQRVLLKEIKNPPVWVAELQMKAEPGFSIKRFRFPEEIELLQESEQLEEAIAG